MNSIPERRPAPGEPPEQPAAAPEEALEKAGGQRGIPVWRCRVCGYLCARAKPPETCPICKVSSDRFEPFQFG